MRHVPGARFAGPIAAMALAGAGCSAASSVPDAAPTCGEFPASVGALSLDPDTTVFVTAAASLLALVTNMETTVLDACVGIATDLLVDDTWTEKGPLNRGTAEAEVMEACAQASRAISAVLHPAKDAGTQSPTSCGLSVSGGGCTVDPTVQAACVANCSGGASCPPPTVLSNCSPDVTTGLCGGACNSTCEGSATAPGACEGSCSGACSVRCDGSLSNPVECQGTCSGHCAGTCTVVMTNAGLCSGTCSGTCDATCTLGQGVTEYCSGECKGSCTGNCKLDANSAINCGALVDCKGGCAGTYTSPTCEGKLTQPTCSADANCQESCQASAVVDASCAPPTVSLSCSGPSDGDLLALMATLEANLPGLLEATQTQGPLVADAVAILNGIGQEFGIRPAKPSRADPPRARRCPTLRRASRPRSRPAPPRAQPLAAAHDRQPCNPRYESQIRTIRASHPSKGTTVPFNVTWL